MLVGWFGRKLVIFFKVRLCIFAFRNQKDGQKIFAAQTPQRKRGFLSTHQTIVGKTFQRRRNFKSSLADALHCSMMGSVQILTIAKARVVFYIVLQSTGLTFPTSSLSRDDYVWMLLLCIAKKICAKLNLTHRVIFFYYPLYLVAIACFGTCLDLSSQSCCLTANGTSRRHRVSHNSFLN